ncbi:hypothetical protein BX666DRAFT_1198950 [Dichotomocladium elegans]|nr:hypothetical protein BX666DRAFT_1198950 [Dichotomocladium elegans]
MSRPFITVDYFSHPWDALDLGCASRELNRQIAEIGRKLIAVQDELDAQHNAMRQWGLELSVSSRHHVSSLAKEKHRLLGDEYRLCRLDNIAWRQYRASCVPNARKIDPITINWQKDSDVIWLYGPLFKRDEQDDDFERRLANIGHPLQTQQQDLQIKSVLRKNTETKEAYVKRLLGKAVSKRLKRRSFPSGLREASMSDPVSAYCNNDNDNGMPAATTSGYKELRFKPDVLEYIYHAERPLRQEKIRRPKKPGTASSSAACQRAKALLLASRMPPSPPLSPPPPEDEAALNHHTSVEENSSPNKWAWGWPFSASSSPPPSSPSLVHQEPTIPGLFYKGVCYGLGGPSTQRGLRSSSS